METETIKSQPYDMCTPRIYYVWSEDLIKHCDRLPAVPGRASLVHDLINSYKILDKIKVVNAKRASYDEMRIFHSELYLDHLKKFTEIDDDYMTEEQDELYGIGYDCPPVSSMFDLVSVIAGGSITAARCLMLGLADVAINWCGGWHHANRFGAEGFCYINDIVIAIENLRKKFPKVLYIDLDVHHGNGVEDAYNISKSVFTLSFHKYEPGFYPGTGTVDDTGNLVGKGYSCNVPLHASYNDETIEYVFERVFERVHAAFAPCALVLQCGADALARDPHGGAGLTPAGYERCLRRVLGKGKPTLLLGGGGYNHENAARLWASLTAAAAGLALPDDIPEHRHWPRYGTDYTRTVPPSRVRDKNTKEYLDECVRKITDNLKTCFGEKELSTSNKTLS